LLQVRIRDIFAAANESFGSRQPTQFMAQREGAIEPLRKGLHALEPRDECTRFGLTIGSGEARELSFDERFL
jgi:hypothetical protein